MTSLHVYDILCHLLFEGYAMIQLFDMNISFLSSKSYLCYIISITNYVIFVGNKKEFYTKKITTLCILISK